MALLSSLAVAAVLALGASPVAGEHDAARQWLDSWATGAGMRFSFRCDGRPFAETAREWLFNVSAKETGRGGVYGTTTWVDPATGLTITWESTTYLDFPAVEWVLRFSNSGTADSPLIEDVLPLDAVFSGDPAQSTLHYSLGDSNSADSFAPRQHRFAVGEFGMTPKGGRSSDGFMPFFNLQAPGQGVAAAIGWSGQWQARFQPEGDGVRVRAGLERTHFRLRPGESVRTPRILLVFWKGDDDLIGNNLFRQVLLSHYLPRRDGQPVWAPICASVTDVDPDGSYEGPHLRVMEPLAKRGVEVFWSDMDPQQWYPGGFPNGTGTWEPDLAKYPRGLAPIGEAAHAAGLEYLLWFEPERVAPGTRIATEHADWVTGGGEGGLFKLHIPEARQWLTDYIDKQISSAALDWIRWDFNIEPLEYWRKNDAPDRQGITEMQHVEGLYTMWGELAQRHHGLLVDICASGGRRIDIETLRYGLPLWHSDLQCSGPHPAADQLQNGGLWRWVPLHGAGCFGYEPSYLFRSAMTSGNIVAVTNAKGALGTADPDTEEAMRASVEMFKKIRPYLLGDFHPLFEHRPDEDAWYGYQFHRPDVNAGVAIVFRREKCAEPAQTLGLQGIDPVARYTVRFADTREERVVSGAELRALPVAIPDAPGSAVVFYSTE